MRAVASHRLFGFRQVLDSAIAIPGAIAPPDTDVSTPALSITATTGPAPCPGDLYRCEGDAFIYSLADTVSFRCTPRNIGITAPGDADPALIAELLIANALPAVLWQQGSFMLHAAAIVLPGQTGAIAIAGASGMGKSSVAAALLAHGAKLVGDDTVAIDCGAAGVTASGLPGGLFDAIVSGEPRGFRPVATDRSIPSAPLAGIVLLADREAAFRFEPVTRLRAVELVLAQQHRPGIPSLLGLRQNVVTRAVAVARSVPVALWHRRAGDKTMTTDEVAAMARCFGATG